MVELGAEVAVDLPESVYERLREEGHFAAAPGTLARLVLSAEAAGLADEAVRLVRTDADSYGHPGHLVEAAAQLVETAKAVLAAAVVCERARGGSWADVGAALDVSRQSAQERFAADMTRWTDGLDAPYVQPGPGRRPAPNLPDAALQPRRTAARLDEWVARRRQPADSTGERSVSAGTVDRDDHRATRLTTAVLAASSRALAADNPPVAERVLAERKAALYEALLLEDPGNTDTIDLLTATRARIDTLRGRGDHQLQKQVDGPVDGPVPGGGR